MTDIAAYDYRLWWLRFTLWANLPTTAVNQLLAQIVR